MQTPFSLRIFVADGDPDSLRIVDKSNWIGKALVFPRAVLNQMKLWCGEMPNNVTRCQYGRV